MLRFTLTDPAIPNKIQILSNREKARNSYDYGLIPETLVLFMKRGSYLQLFITLGNNFKALS
jgi:hypothetical protein